jgi:hypothetical protein
MILRLRPALGHHDCLPGVIRGFGQDLQEQGLGDVVRA